MARKYRYARKYPPHFSRLVIGRLPDPAPADARKAAERALELVRADPRAVLFFAMPTRKAAPPDDRDMLAVPEVVEQLRLLDRWLVRLDPRNEVRVLDHLFPEQRAHLEACRRPAIEHDPDGHGGVLLIEHEAAD